MLTKNSQQASSSKKESKPNPKQIESEHNTTGKMENLDATAATIDRIDRDVEEVEKVVQQWKPIHSGMKQDMEKRHRSLARETIATLYS
ncbi:hypothetical protein RMATCC62417_14441 [Rhizopus microsporus]|nr:hypothetical protein RMATCC62417_14441 [Rhizopus microsporus]